MLDHAEAQYRPGLCHKHIDWISMDESEAFVCFSEALENELPSVMAQFEFAQCFYYGIWYGNKYGACLILVPKGC